MSLPRLHLVTSSAVLASADFAGAARRISEVYGPAVLIQLRGHETSGRQLYDIAASLMELAGGTGTTVLINDRVDIALSLELGAQIGARSIPVDRARALLGDRLLGYSAHGADRARSAAEEGADFVVLGTIYPSASHPERPAAGIDLVRATAAATAAPVVAIGGITPARTAAVRTAGGHGVAVVSGVWGAPDPTTAVGRYLAELA